MVDFVRQITERKLFKRGRHVHVRASSPTAGAGPLQLIHSGATTHTGTLSLLGVPLIPWFAWNDEQARHVLLLKA